MKKENKEKNPSELPKEHFKVIVNKNRGINEYKIGFYVLVVILLIFVGVDFWSSTKEPVVSYNGCNPCDYITGTPSWLKDGKLITSGYQPNVSIENLIEYNITFVYSEKCGWCKKQIEDIGEEDFNRLKEEGLVLKC